MIRTFKLSPEICARIERYIKSKTYCNGNEFEKSQYWIRHSEFIKIKIEYDKIHISGQSGIYLPKTGIRGFLFGILKSFWGAVNGNNQRNVSLLFDALYKFNKNDVQSKPYLRNFGASSNYRLDQFKVGNKAGNYNSYSSIKKKLKGRYRPNFQTLYSYYIYNIINYFSSLDARPVIIDIGSGSGNLLSVMFENIPSATFIDIDLPEMILVASCFIHENYPDAKILLPNEVDDHFSITDFDFVFLVPSQADRILPRSVDIVTNISSFQEMAKQQVELYFRLIDKVLKPGGIFCTTNRAEKFSDIANAEGREEPPSRFSEYPWVSEREVLVYEVCPFM